MKSLGCLKKQAEIKIKGVTLKINIFGMLCALFLIGLLAIYVLGNREMVKNTSQNNYSLKDASITELDGRMEVTWGFEAAYPAMTQVMVGIIKAPEYTGKTITITVESDNGIKQSQEYVIEGTTFTENYAMGMQQKVGKGTACKFIISGDSEVLGNIVYGYTDYLYYNIPLLLILLLSCFFIFLNFGVRLEESNIRSRRIRKGYKAGSLLLLPVMSVYVLEYLGGSIDGLKAHVIIANAVICSCLYLAVFIVTNRLRFSLLFVSCFIYVLAIAEYFVLLFRGSPITPYDITSFQTAMSVAGQYQFELSEKLLLSLVMFVAVISVACRMPFKIREVRKRIAAAAGGVGIIAGLGMLFYGVIYPAWNLSYSTWAPIDTYMEDGYLMTTMVFAKYARVIKPDGYSAKRAEEILAEFEPEDKETGSPKPVNLIVIMNESWSSLDYVKETKTNIPYNEFYQSLTENTIKGNLYVSILGGNTVQTEYEFLTGNSVSFLPPGATAYEFFVDENTGSICDTLKAEDYTCLAMHPFGAGGYNRDKAYEYFGFEEFMAEEAFEGYEAVRSFYSDEATYQKVIELYENKNPGENLFIWDLTMQNHGGYVTDESFEKDVFLTEYPELDQASTYVTLMKDTDEALEKLISYFEKVEEPTMIVMFGDHQPNLSDGTYDLLYGKEEIMVEGEELEKRYMTPFLIWNNYGLQEDYIEQMSANYFSSYVFRQAGLPETAYSNLLYDLYQSYPVINIQGVYDNKGTYWSWDDVEDSADYEKIHNYQIVQYYMIKDRK